MSQNPLFPVVALRDVVVLPHSVTTLYIGRERSLHALHKSYAEPNAKVLLLTQKDSKVETPKQEDLYEIGCLAKILQLLKLPDGAVKILVEGLERIKIEDLQLKKDMLVTSAYEILPSKGVSDAEQVALWRTLDAQLDQYVKLNKKSRPNELLPKDGPSSNLERLSDLAAAYLPLKLEDRQTLLEETSVASRVEYLIAFLDKETQILEVEQRIRSRVKSQIDKNQRDYHLNEQIKAIQKELNDGEESPEFEQFEQRIQSAGMPKAAKEKALAELKKLKLMPSMSAEATVVRNYLDVMLDVPWKKTTKINQSLADAVRILDEDHYGLEKVKERIVEYLAVQQRVGKLKAPILCLVGPPGVGKTSLGQSIARATNRRYTRMALGGVHDEAEIRGHRRTYIGAIPGKIISNMSKVGVRNPLFLLDEIDKMSSDFRGDPASAMLEVLDPEQNNTFQDHYLEVDYDLSNVMFVATSNSERIPPALLDRMEIIRLSGYTEEEKIHIAIRHLIPKMMKENGLATDELSFQEDAVRDIIRYYTSEAGVRNLQREIGRICRKVVKEAVLAQAKPSKRKKAKAVVISPKLLAHYLGVPKFDFDRASKDNQVGEVNGLAWTQVGGVLLPIEATVVPGKGNQIVTGSLGDVMKESMQAARTVVRARAEQLGITQEQLEKTDIHIHAPDGATPKDGPSAGIAITTAMVSALTGIPVKCTVGMTGEVTLRGEVWPIGGLKEKLLAALRAGLKTVLIPEKNVKDLVDIPDNVKNELEIVPVRWIDQVLEQALAYMPEPIAKTETLKTAPPLKKKTASRVRVS